MSKQELVVYASCDECRHNGVHWRVWCLHPKIIAEDEVQVADGGGRLIDTEDIPVWCPLDNADD